MRSQLLEPLLGHDDLDFVLVEDDPLNKVTRQQSDLGRFQGRSTRSPLADQSRLISVSTNPSMASAGTRLTVPARVCHSAEAPDSHSTDTDARPISSYGLRSSSCHGHHRAGRPASLGWTPIVPCPVQTGWRRDSSALDPTRPGQQSAGVVRRMIHSCALSGLGRSGFGAGSTTRPDYS